MNKCLFLFIFVLGALALKDKNVVLTMQVFVITSILLGAKISHQLAKQTMLISVPIFVAGIYGFYRFPASVVMKDCFYFLNPILFLIMGFSIGKKVGSLKIFLRTCIICGTILSCLHILTTILANSYTVLLDPRNVRDSYGVSNYVLSVCALTLLISYEFIWKQPLVSRKFSLLCLFPNLFSLYISGSRSDILFFLGCISCVLYFRAKNRFTILLIITIVGLGCWKLIQILPENNRTAIILKQSINELSIREAGDTEERNNFYRGWETYRAWKTYQDGHAWELLAGHGMGTVVDLGTYVPLGKDSEPRRYIPIIHNGFMYILLKTGVFGILLFGLFYANIFRHALKNQNREIIMAASLVTAIFITNALIATIFNFAYVTYWLITGVFLYYANISNQNRNHYHPISIND